MSFWDATASAEPLTREGFQQACDAIAKQGPQPHGPMLVSKTKLEQMKKIRAALAERQRRLDSTIYYFSTGWRRLRFVKRFRLMRELIEVERDLRVWNSTLRGHF